MNVLLPRRVLGTVLADIEVHSRAFRAEEITRIDMDKEA